MRVLPALPYVAALTLIACRENINDPSKAKANPQTISSMNARVALNASERSLLDDLVKDMPQDKAARVRDLITRKDGLVIGGNPKDQAKIDEIYRSMRSRSSAQSTHAPHPGPRTSQNSWAPRAQDMALINRFVDRVPPQYRDLVKDHLLRTDLTLSATNRDPEGQKLLGQIYAARQEVLGTEDDKPKK